MDSGWRMLNALAACFCRRSYQDMAVQVQEDDWELEENCTMSGSSGDAPSSATKKYKYKKGNKIVMPHYIPPRFPRAVSPGMAAWFERTARHD